MGEPRKFSSLLVGRGGLQDDPGGRPHHCGRCLSLAEEYERHDPSWRPPEAASYVKDGVVYWLANCEACNQLEFDARHLKRLGAIGSPDESGLTDRERERRRYETDKLVKERAKYAQWRKEREARYAKRSGSPSASGDFSHRGRGSDEAALTLDPAPDYAMRRAEPDDSFADWWEKQ